MDVEVRILLFGLVGELVLHQPVVAEVFHVDVGNHQLLLQREAFGFGQHHAILGNHRAPGIHQVGGRFAESAGGIHIPAEATPRLLGYQLAAVGLFADGLVAGRKVDDDIGPRHRHRGAGRNRHPQVFTNIDRHGHPLGVEDELPVHGIGVFADVHQIFQLAFRRREPALLLVFPVVREVHLRHHPDDFPRLDGHRRVEQLVRSAERQPYEGEDGQILRFVYQLEQRLFGVRKQRILQEQVLASISRDAKLWEDQHLYALVGRPAHQPFDLFYIIKTIGHLYLGHRGGHFYISIIHTCHILIQTFENFWTNIQIFLFTFAPESNKQAWRKKK